MLMIHIIAVPITMILMATTIRRDILPVWYFSRRGAEDVIFGHSLRLCVSAGDHSSEKVAPL